MSASDVRVGEKWLRGRRADATCAGYAETITERIAAKCDGRTTWNFELLLAYCTGVQCLSQDSLKIVDVKINVHRCPVALVSANIVGSLGRFASCWLLHYSDLRIATLENYVRRNRSCDLG